jgi:hypothetical protein
MEDIKMRKKIAIFMCLLLVCCMFVASAVVIAKGKPPKPPPGGDPPPAGTVFFKYNDGGGMNMWSMKADGSEKTELGIDYCIDRGWITFGALSRLKHGDHYWFIRFMPVGGSYPDGEPIRELFAVRDDGALEVQLTDDPSLATFKYARAFEWGINDNEITWSAKRWTEDPVPIDFGIYTAAISFDSNGDVTGLSETPYLFWDTGYIYNSNNDYYIPDVKRFDWSPDGNNLVLAKWNLDMYNVDLQADSESSLGTSGYKVSWSPDGSKIAFLRESSLRTINQDGTNEQILVAAIHKGKDRFVDNERIDWSPDSNHVTYTWQVVNRISPPDSDHYVYRVDVNSGKKTSMTNDLEDAYSHSWR